MTTTTLRQRSRAAPSRPPIPIRTKANEAKPSRNTQNETFNRPTSGKGQIRIHEDKSQTLPVLDEVTATGKFNKALRVLSAAIKSRAKDEHNKPVKITETPTKASSRTVAGLRSPLLNRSPNRRTPDVSSAVKQGTEPIKQIPSGSEYVHEAEIAVHALSCLFQAKTSSPVESSTQLDQGSTVLINKLLALQLYGLAVQELCNFGSRLLNRRRKGTLTDAIKPPNGAEDRKRYLMSWLAVPIVATNASEATQIVTFTSQILKVLLRDPTYCHESIARYLDPSLATGPVHFIQRAMQDALIGQQQAAAHVSSLSQLIMSLAECIETRDVPSHPFVQFQLRCIALRARCLWWSLAGHQYEAVKDLWKPFGRALTDIVEGNSRNGLQSTDILDQFAMLRKSAGDLSPESQQMVPNTIFLMLGEVAEENGDPDKALEFYEELQHNTADVSDYYLIRVSCKLASLRLGSHQLQDGEKLVSSLDIAAAGLQGPLKVTATELDILLSEVVKLRRVAIRLIQRLTSAANSSEEDIQGWLSDACSHAIIMCTRFVSRYLRASLVSPSMSTDGLSGNAKVQKLWKTLVSTVDSAIAVLRIGAVDENLKKWQETEQAVHEVHQFILLIFDNCDAEKHQHLRPVFGKLANIFCCRAQMVQGPDKITFLKKAISIIKKRPADEWHDAGLSAKYEKLAALLYGQGNTSEAVGAYRQAVNSSIDPKLAGVLEIMAENGATEQCWDNTNNRIRELDRLLAAFAKILVRISEKNLSIPSKILDPEVSDVLLATLLERCLLHLVRHELTGPLRKLAAQTLDIVLSVYDHKSYPLRRLRVMLQILLYETKQPKSASSEPLYKIADTENAGDLMVLETMNCDQPLASSKTYLVTSFQIATALYFGRLSAELLDSTVEAWTAMMDARDHHSKAAWNIFNIDDFVGLLELLADFADAMALNSLRLRILLLSRRVLLGQIPASESSRLYLELRIASHLTKCGHLSRSQEYLDNAKALLSDEVNLETIEWHLASAEHLLAGERFMDTLHTLDAARNHFDTVKTTSSFTLGMKQDALLARAALITSGAYLGCGQVADALQTAKHSVKCVLRLWTVTEKSLSKVNSDQQAITPPSGLDNSIDSLSRNFTRSTTKESGNTKSSYVASVFWPQVDLYIRSFINMSSMSGYDGLLQDALYYAEQAKKLLLSVGAQNRLTSIDSVLARIYLGAGHHESGLKLLDEFRQHSKEPEPETGAIQLHMTLSEAHEAIGEIDIALEHSLAATRTFERLNYPAKTEKKVMITARSTASRVRKPVTKKVDTTLAPNTRHRTASAMSNVSKKTVKENQEKVIVQDSTPSENQTMAQRKRLLWARIGLLSKAGRIDEALQLVHEQQLLPMNQSERTHHAMLVYRQAKQSLVNDSVHNILLESTISWPSLRPILVEAQPKKPPKTSQRTRARKVQSQHVETPKVTGDLDQSSAEALALVGQLFEGRQHEPGALLSLQQARAIHVESSLLLTAIDPKTGASQGMFESFHADRVDAMMRETIAIAADGQLQNKKSLSYWPKPDDLENLPTESIKVIRQDVITTLPRSWSVVSIGVTPDKKHLLLSKLCRDTEELVLRLPLERSEEAEDREEAFDFTTCHSELLELVSQANTSAHSATCGTDKQAKKDWWAERERLDQKLRCLLENIENLWIGGFRGIFATSTPNDTGRRTFSQAFHRILAGHLPSRKKSSRSGHAVIHDNVLDLFLGLGDPDAIELDDNVADLLAFVVDILQFSGERNAYDEIDFDMMAVETVDAIRAFHKTMYPETAGRMTNHTILILGKELLPFPWESLPCLRGKSVSRLPSLRCLSQRLKQLNFSPTASEASEANFCIDSSSGSYILNPSSDLASTQSTFSTVLSKAFPNYASIVARKPSETEFLETLTSELCLYFGHGSGAQYVRGRNVRRMNHCATTFLMGCSSVFMHEAGEYEPYGVPWNYMHAGAPAVVGTLWDVTDRDIDRFALRTFVNWGLLEPECLEVEAAGKGKGKKRKLPAIEVGEILGGAAAKGKVTLGEAVAKAREVCVMPYLNGAAPVIYGIPVRLK